MFIAHGDSDSNISVENSVKLYDMLNSVDKELVIVEGGRHIGLMNTGGKDYKSKVFGFVLRNFE